MGITAAGAASSRRYGFPYARLALPTLAVYALLGFFMQVALLDVQRTMSVVSLAALLDVTAGSALVSRIGPPRAAARGGRLLAGIAVALVAQIASAFVGATWLLFGVAWLLMRRH